MLPFQVSVGSLFPEERFCWPSHVFVGRQLKLTATEERALRKNL